MTHEVGAPRRLAESPGTAGDVLRQALTEPVPSEPLPRFTQLQERRLGRSRRQTAALVLAGAFALALSVRALRPAEPPPLTVRAEPVASPPESVPSAAPQSPVEEGPVRLLAPGKPLTARSATNKSSRAASASAAQSADAPAPVAAAMPAPGELHGSAKACAELARGGAVEEAIGCYEALSSGAGVTAELALFEQARLAGKALRQPARALALLDTYRQRFPNGSLRGEAMLARIEWSLAAGDSKRAREGVEEALASGLLGERRAELERLRATLDSDAAPQ